MYKITSKLFMIVAFIFALAGCSQPTDANGQAQTNTSATTQEQTQSSSATQSGPVSASEYFAGMKGEFVVEFLWLGCSHCQDVEPYVNDAKNDNPRIKVVKIPTVFSERWRQDAAVFYAGQELGVGSTELLNYYKTVRVSTEKLPTIDEVANFVGTTDGNTAKDFMMAYGSDAVEEKVEQAVALTQEFDIQGTPTFVVNGKDVVPNEGVSSYEGLIEKVYSNFE